MSRTYSMEPTDAQKHTAEFDRFYTLVAPAYSFCVKALPVWKTWLRAGLPHIKGPKVLEVSFGTGYLLSQYAGDHEVHGVDYNEKMVQVAGNNLKEKGLRAELVQGNVEDLPYGDEQFDCLVNTMAFTGYPDGQKALAEMHRVLKVDGRLVLVDLEFPDDGGWIGTKIVQLWQLGGDIVREMPTLLEKAGFAVQQHREIGGFGSVHLFICTKVP